MLGLLEEPKRPGLLLRHLFPSKAGGIPVRATLHDCENINWPSLNWYTIQFGQGFNVRFCEFHAGLVGSCELAVGELQLLRLLRRAPALRPPGAPSAPSTSSNCTCCLGSNFVLKLGWSHCRSMLRLGTMRRRRFTARYSCSCARPWSACTATSTNSGRASRATLGEGEAKSSWLLCCCLGLYSRAQKRFADFDCLGGLQCEGFPVPAAP
jgi:hypothetical protein